MTAFTQLRSVSFLTYCGMALIVGGCATDHVAKDWALDRAQAVALEQSLPRNEVESVLAFGLNSIASRALEEVSVRDLALEGMRGLAVIDPELTLEAHSSEIELFYEGRVLRRIMAPLPDDAESWSDALYEALEAAYGVSPEIRRVEPEKVYEAVFDGALANLDIFSRYAGKQEAQRNRDRRDGHGGIGVRLEQIDERYFLRLEDAQGPAYRAGVRDGDMLVSVDGQAVISQPLRDVRSWIWGPIQTEVELEIERPQSGVAQKLFVWRELIIEETVSSFVEDGMLVIKISSFNERTDLDVSDTLKKVLLEQGDAIKGIVLDLRENPGGILRRAVRVANLFLSGGRVISTAGRHPDSREIYEADPIDLSQGRPLVVLINANSASGAEIVAAALQDRNRAVVVGTGSFGKGTVQSVQRLPNDGELTVTWSRLVAPSGYAFHGLGVRPSVCTSGVADRADGVPLREMKGESLMKEWRGVPVSDLNQRKKMRRSCQAEGEVKGIDLQIARDLIHDKPVYSRYRRFETIANVAQ